MVLSNDGPIYHAWKVCGWLYGGVWKWGVWFRVFGRGPHIARDRMVLFSERYGHRRVIRIGRWSLEWLHACGSSSTSNAGKEKE